MSLAVDGCHGGQSNKVICKNYFTDIQSSESFSFCEKILSQLATISNKKYDILTILQNLIIYYYLSRKSVSAVTYLILPCLVNLFVADCIGLKCYRNQLLSIFQLFDSNIKIVLCWVKVLLLPEHHWLFTLSCYLALNNSSSFDKAIQFLALGRSLKLGPLIKN